MNSQAWKNEARTDGDTASAVNDLYLVFHLGSEDYGIDLGYVTEIVSRQNITPIPNAPEYIRGVINLRGQIIPVVDVRTRFRLPFREYDDRTCSIVITVGTARYGLIVDAVDEVIRIPQDNISPAPLTSLSHSSCCVRGMGCAEHTDKIRLILDVSRFFDELELEQLAVATI